MQVMGARPIRGRSFSAICVRALAVSALVGFVVAARPIAADAPAPVEVSSGAFGSVPLEPSFSAGLRELCTKHDAVLIFDEVVNGWFYPTEGNAGFSVTDEEGIPFWTDFQQAGGVAELGYPISRRWVESGLAYQAFQKAVLQWQPQKGTFYANTYDRLSAAGLDDWLDAAKNVPKPQEFPEDEGQPFSVVMRNHLALLERNPSIKAAWFGNESWLSAYGLPVAYEERGGVRVLRAQRAVLQQWMVPTSFTTVGGVVVSNAGEHYAEAGLIPANATDPQALEEVLGELLTANTAALPGGPYGEHKAWITGEVTNRRTAPAYAVRLRTFLHGQGGELAVTDKVEIYSLAPG